MTTPTASDLVSFVVKVDGNAIPGSYQVQAITVEQAINRIATAVLTILDGDAAAEDFAISASETFVPGKAITIELGYDNANVLVFSGIVTSQALSYEPDTGPRLEVGCHDKAVAMTIGRKSTTWSKAKDSDAIASLIAAAGLGAKVEVTKTELPELVQYYTSDWDFMIARAEVNGLVVAATNGSVNVIDPGKAKTAVLTAAFGSSMLGFRTALNAATQLSQVTARAWDAQQQAIVSATAPNDSAGPGNLPSKTLAKVAAPADFMLQTTAAVAKDSLSDWAKAQMKKSQLAKITGTVRLQGTSIPTLGSFVTLAGLSARFNGDQFVSSVQHRVTDGNWETEIGIGMPLSWFAEEQAVTAPEEAGLLPGIGGLATATVLKIDQDPDGEYRIKLHVPMFDDRQGLWARLANLYASNGAGTFFLPEIGDEVMVGFLNQDPRFPIILGSVYSEKNKPFSAFTPNAKNNLKGVVSKAGLRVLFDDENAVLSVITPKNNKLVLDDKAGQIEMRDQNGNAITMSSSGIKIHSDKAIAISAGQTVSVAGVTGVTVQSTGGDVATDGVNIKETAAIEYTAKGNTTATVQGGASLTLKAALIM
ncbi:MAG: type VI secretion system tip protein VgrG, partial [Rhizomicrobium sp.]|nr:type VI secretion system tip protein VgrG [Rhizomicrobium sp.]